MRAYTHERKHTHTRTQTQVRVSERVCECVQIYLYNKYDIIYNNIDYTFGSGWGNLCFSASQLPHCDPVDIHLFQE